MTDNNLSHDFSNTEITEPPGFLYVDHIAIAVCNGEMENHVKMYKQIGFKELHREEIGGTDQVREVLLKIGESPNLIQLLEPLSRIPCKNKLTVTMDEGAWYMWG